MSEMFDGRLFVTVREARYMLGISATHFYRLVGRGELRLSKTGKRTLVPTASIRAFAAKIDPQSSRAA